MIRREFVTVRANDGVEKRVPREVATMLLAYWPDIFTELGWAFEDKAMRPTEDK